MEKPYDRPIFFFGGGGCKGPGQGYLICWFQEFGATFKFLTFA